MPSGPSHLSTEIWGPEAEVFDFIRFMRLEEKVQAYEKTGLEEREQRRAYFPFRGRKHLHPRRFFAFIEILGILTALFLGFDVVAKDGSFP